MRVKTFLTISLAILLINFGFGNTALAQDRISEARLHYLKSRLNKLKQDSGKSIQELSQAVAADPNSAHLRAEWARQLAEENQFHQAVIQADKALSLDPKNPSYHLLRGKLYSVLENKTKAMEEYQTCLKYDAGQEECYVMMAREHLLEKNPTKAEATLLRLLKKKSTSMTGRFLLAGLYSKKQKSMAKALNIYAQILEEEPNHPAALGGMAELYLKQKKKPEAETMLLRLEKVLPGDKSTQLRLGVLYYDRKDFPKAVQHFTKLLKLSPQNDRVLYYLGVLEIQNKNYEQAKKYLLKITKTSEFYADALLRLILVSERQNKIKEVRRWAQLALKERPQMVELYDFLAGLYAREKRFAKALKVLQTGLKELPKNETLLFTQGILYEKRGDFKSSMKSMEALIKVNPNHALALNYVGYSYAERGINLDQALRMLTKAHALKPKNGYILDSLAWAHFKLGHLQKALTLLQQAHQYKPEEPTILEHLGDVYLKLGQSQQAQHYFQEALRAALKQKPESRREKADLKRVRTKAQALAKKQDS